MPRKCGLKPVLFVMISPWTSFEEDGTVSTETWDTWFPWKRKCVNICTAALQRAASDTDCFLAV